MLRTCGVLVVRLCCLLSGISAVTSFADEKRPECTAASWRNPKVTDSDRLVRENIPEGLTLVGRDGRPTTNLDPNKKTVVYVHGWTPTERLIPVFPYPNLWNSEFNTFIYYWHVRTAQNAFAAHNEASKEALINDFATEFNEMRNRLQDSCSGGYSKELRIVGFSLGAILASYVAERVFYQNNQYSWHDVLHKVPRRLDLLEPIFPESIIAADTVVLRYGDGQIQLTKAQVDELATGIPQKLIGWGVPVTAYGSGFVTRFKEDLYKTIPSQTVAPDWLGEGHNSLEEQHIMILPYYFKSIAANQKAPVLVDEEGNVIGEAWSAKTPHETLKSRKWRYYKQVGGTNSSSLSQHTYVSLPVESSRSGILVNHAGPDGRGTYTSITIPIWQKGF